MENISPKSIQSESVSAFGYGTIIHKILESIDYTNINFDVISNNIDMYKEQSGINLTSIKKKLYNYLNGDILTYIKEAKDIQKEQPFVIYDNLEEIPNCNFKEKTYIQGVIDLLITLKNNNKIIVDFKTDRIDNKQQLIDRYKVQLEVYKKGVELSLNGKVQDMYIYSFYLDELIKIV